jgi:hypothetical protein
MWYEAFCQQSFRSFSVVSAIRNAILIERSAKQAGFATVVFRTPPTGLLNGNKALAARQKHMAHARHVEGSA